MDSVIYFNRAFRAEREATISVRSRALNYGLGCFAGIRGYKTDDGQHVHVFRLDRRADNLDGITRQSLITLAREDLDISFVERPIGRTELYVAEEVFLCGTGAEITPVRSVDRRPVGDGAIGPLTRRLSERFEAVVRGRVPERADWLTPVW